MNQILLYSRKSTPTIDQLADQLQSIGFSVEQTQNLNIPRVMLNPYQIVHFVLDELPLTIKETVFLTLIKTLGKATLLSIYNFEHKISKKTFDFLCPDGLTVSQTNYLKYFRAWNCSKIIMPSLFEVKPTPRKLQTSTEPSGVLIPLYSDINFASKIETDHNVYFDARPLLTEASASMIRKSWVQMIQNKKIPTHFHLILSEQKVNDLIDQEALMVVLADPQMSHLQFSQWLERIINKNHLIILNDQQATGFSHSWTSGRNCQVVSYSAWVNELNTFLAKPLVSNVKSNFKTAELVEPLMNDLSRLYTKILHQKASLLTPHSANITK